ncbi:hypothetical protein IAI10_00960 [Clostridium sp. 19966]|uniref:hypothetical protein n=1 Tax=Clostridium sp. 19966 TaxID=2768166 RepID=UPI0028DFA445|nr:hypothetical protein [Clostridium sp. 19966]MDT8715248.1 hypothetical protein [Clostridium sp. 19966]
MKKVLAIVMTAAVAAGILSGCGSKPGGSGSKDITLSVFFNRTDLQDTYLKDYADKYKKKTGVTIKWTTITNYDDDVKVKMNSSDYGDVLLVPSGVATGDFANFFEPLGKNTDDKNRLCFKRMLIKAFFVKEL